MTFDFDKNKKKWNCCDEKVETKNLEKHVKQYHFWGKGGD